MAEGGIGNIPKKEATEREKNRKPAKDKKPVVVPPDKRQPTNPAYMIMSKKDVVEAERVRLEKAAKVAAYAKSLEKGEDGVEATAETAAPAAPAKGKKGRPSKK